MKNRICFAASVAAVLLSTLAVAGPAHASDREVDHRPCVDNREVAGYSDFGKSRAKLESEWEVTGLGTQRYVIGAVVIAYPWCGHGDDTSKAFVGIGYGARNRMRMQFKWDCEWDVPSSC